MIWRFAIRAFLLLNVFFQINCYTALHLYGIFQNLSSLSLYNEALVELNTTKADGSLYLRASHGLNQIVQNVEALAQNITANSATGNVVFSDMYSLRNEILKEALLKGGDGLAANSNQSVIVDNNLSGTSQVRLFFVLLNDSFACHCIRFSFFQNFLLMWQTGTIEIVPVVLMFNVL